MKDNFILAECEALREHMEGVVNELRTLERFNVLATAAFWGWIGVNEKSESLINNNFVVYLPFILMLFTFLKSRALKDRYRNAASYIKRVENELLLNSDLGWQRSKERSQGWLPLWSDAFYIILIIINFVLATIWFIKYCA